MNQTPEINELAAAMAIAQGAIKNAVADTENPFFKSYYADLASVREAIKKPFADNGLSIVQLPITVDGKPALTTRVMHKSGQWLEGTILLLLEKPTMQSLGSATTYAKRYALAAIAGVAEEDDDGNAASNKTAHQAKPVQTPAKPLPTEKPAIAPVATTNAAPANPPKENGITDKQRKMLWARIKSKGMNDDDAAAFLKAHSGKESSHDWTRYDFDRVLNAIDGLPEAAGHAQN